MNAGCHGSASLAPRFAFAGTVYKEVSGTAVNPGAVVRIFKEAAGQVTLVAKTTTDQAGNFWIASDAADFPYIADVTACGSDASTRGIRSMSAPITAEDGNCNKGGCHGVPGAMAIHLSD